MADIAIDNTLDVFIDQTGDLAYATGRNAFEQQITLSLLDFYHDLIGEDDPDTIIKSLEVGARRAVESVGRIDRLATIDARFSEDSPNTVLVDIIFDTGDALDFELDDSGITASTPSGQVFDESLFEDEHSFDVYDDGSKV